MLNRVTQCPLPGIGKEQLCGWHYPYNGASSILFINEPGLGVVQVTHNMLHIFYVVEVIPSALKWFW